MSELSIFIDESGDFGPYAPHSLLYLITLVFHDQSRSIAEQIGFLRRKASEAGFSERHNIHSAPLIRRESDYASMSMTDRRKLFRSLFGFLRTCDISYKTFVFRKREFSCHDEMVSRMSREVGQFVRENLEFFQSFDRIVVYYDNGQKEITNIVNTVFNVFLEAEVRKVSPSDYALFQAADMLCTLELLSCKVASGHLTNSELEFFRSVRDLRKNYLKPCLAKRFSA